MWEKAYQKEESAPLVMTIGHSTRTLEEFIDLLKVHRATCVVDVRTVPQSRRNPQFNKASLPDSLKKAGLGYGCLRDLAVCVMQSEFWPTNQAGEMPPFGVMLIICIHPSLRGPQN